MAVGYRVMAMGDGRSGDTLYLRGPGASDARQALLATLAGVHPQLAPYELGTIAELVDRQLTPGRVATAALGWMSVAAVVLAAVGLFGAIAQSATVRLHEFGVRLALGARRHDVAGLIVREALLISGIGLVLGAGGATLAASALQSGMLETISPSDPVPALGVCGAVVAIAAMAALVPVRRVMAIDPVKTLRGD